MGRILTVEQAAEMLQLNPQVVREYLRKGKLPGSKIGRHWRVSEEQLDAYLRASHIFLAPGRALTIDDLLRGKRALAEAEERERQLNEWKNLSREERKKRLDSIVGAFADVRFSSEDLMRDRREEVRREEWRDLTPEEKAARVHAARGVFAEHKGMLDDFLARKHAETREEERRWQERHNKRGLRGGKTE